MSTKRRDVSPQYQVKTDPRKKKNNLAADQETEVR